MEHDEDQTTPLIGTGDMNFQRTKIHFCKHHELYDAPTACSRSGSTSGNSATKKKKKCFSENECDQF